MEFFIKSIIDLLSMLSLLILSIAGFISLLDMCGLMPRRWSKKIIRNKTQSQKKKKQLIK